MPAQKRRCAIWWVCVQVELLDSIRFLARDADNAVRFYDQVSDTSSQVAVGDMSRHSNTRGLPHLSASQPPLTHSCTVPGYVVCRVCWPSRSHPCTVTPLRRAPSSGVQGSAPSGTWHATSPMR